EAALKSKPQVSPTTGEVLVSENFLAEDLLIALDTLSSASGVPIIYEDTVQGIVNCKFTDVPLSEALKMVLAGTPYYFKKMDSYYLVGAGSITDLKFGQLSDTEHVHLNYLSATTAKGMLVLPFQQYVQADTDPNGRMLTITAPEPLLGRIVSELKSLDIKPSQVLLDASIVVLEKSDLLNLGVTWGWPTIQSGVFSNDRHGLGDPLLDFAGQTAWGIQIGYTPTATFTNSLDQVLDLLQMNNLAKIVSKPTVFARNNMLARIEVLQEDYYILYARGLEANYYSRQEMETIVTGTVLAITPHIGDMNDIVLDMAVEVSNTIPNPTNPDFPRVIRRKAQSSLRVDNGGTVAIAGLTESQTMNTKKKVPFFSDLPLVGSLFTDKNDQNSNKEVAIFVTASIVHESNPVDLDFTKRGLLNPQLQTTRGIPSYQSLNSSEGMYNYNMTTPMRQPVPQYYAPQPAPQYVAPQPMPQQPAPRRSVQPSAQNPNYETPEPFMNFPDYQGETNVAPQAPSRRSPEDDFRQQLRNSLATQGQYGGGY
ncbi:MAG: hypothetical protein P8016_06135, partial [Sedimentisphaerales bacterium]